MIKGDKKPNLRHPPFKIRTTAYAQTLLPIAFGLLNVLMGTRLVCDGKDGIGVLGDP